VFDVLKLYVRVDLLTLYIELLFVS